MILPILRQPGLVALLQASVVRHVLVAGQSDVGGVHSSTQTPATESHTSPVGQQTLLEQVSSLPHEPHVTAPPPHPSVVAIVPQAFVGHLVGAHLPTLMGMVSV